MVACNNGRMATSITSVKAKIEVGSWVKHEGITRVVSDVFADYVNLVDSKGDLVATVHVDAVELINTITVTYQACTRCGEASSECTCRPMIIGITY